MNMISTGSPGTRTRIRKTSRVMTGTMTTTVRSRRTTNRPMAGLPTPAPRAGMPRDPPAVSSPPAVPDAARGRGARREVRRARVASALEPDVVVHRRARPVELVPAHLAARRDHEVVAEQRDDRCVLEHDLLDLLQQR